MNIAAVQVKRHWTQIWYSDGTEDIIFNEEAVEHEDNLMSIIKMLLAERS